MQNMWVSVVMGNDLEGRMREWELFLRISVRGRIYLQLQYRREDRFFLLITAAWSHMECSICYSLLLNFSKASVSIIILLCNGPLPTKMLLASVMVNIQAAADRNAILLEDNDKDKRLLRQLEKNLKMKKRKSSNLPLAFVNDGLDCILCI